VSIPPIWQVVVTGNSSPFEVEMLTTGTALPPVFHNVTTIGVEDVAPRPVGGNASPAHVITKVDGVTVDGDVVGALEQLAASAAATITTRRRSRSLMMLGATTRSIVATPSFASA
jgi:hypothetical protein